MIRAVKTHYERVVFATIALLLLASFGWSWWARGEIKSIRADAVGMRLSKSTYHAAEWSLAPAKHGLWAKPLSQSAGSGWVYELFTPPVVFFNSTTGKFAVSPPAEPAKTSPAFAIELMEVRRELFRLQLTGYFGEPGSFTAVFVQPGTSGTLFAREGTRFDELGLTLRKFSVHHVSPTDDVHSGVSDLIAFAELYDERTGVGVMLNTLEPGYADASVATIRTSFPNATLREVREGDTISEGKLVYRIRRITYAPTELVVEREESGNAAVETKVLRPAGTDSTAVALQSSEPRPLFSRQATGINTPGK